MPSDNRGRRPQRWPTRARGVLNALNLSTLLGLGVATLGGASLRRGPDGLWLGEGYRLALPKAGAFTIGNVVTTASTFTDLLTHQPDVLDHESRHAWQYAVTGLVFFPLYTAASGWSVLVSGNPATSNPFERHAGLVSGGYLSPGSGRPRRSGRRRRPDGRQSGTPTKL